MTCWTDQELLEIVSIVEAAIVDGQDEGLNIAALWMLSGSRHSVTQGLMWAQQMLYRPVSDTWQSMVTAGVERAARELGSVMVEHDSLFDFEEWVPPAGQVQNCPAQAVLQHAAFAGLTIPLQFGRGGWLLRAPRNPCAPPLSPLARYVVMEREGR